MAEPSRSDRVVVAYARALVRWRWLVLLASLILAAVAIAGARHLTMIASYKYHFSPGDAQLEAMIDIENTYTKTDNVLFVLAPDRGDVFQKEVLQAVAWLTEESWQLPYSIRVDSLTNFQHTWSEGDELIVEDLVEDAAALGAEDLGRVRDIALSEPLLVGSLVARDARATAVNVTIQLPDEGGEVFVGARAREIASAVRERHPDLRVALTGLVMLSDAFEVSAAEDLATLVPLMFLALVIAMLLFLRSVWGTLGTILVILLATAAGLGLAAWAGIPITALSSAAPTIIMTIAVADGVHILVTLTQQMRGGRGKHEALVESLRVNWQPVFLTSLTTIVGFLSLNSSSVRSLNDLGNITALGVAAAWFFSVTALPAFVAIVPYRVRPARVIGGFSMERFVEWLIARRVSVLWTSVAVLLVCCALIPRIELNDLFVGYFDRSMKFRQDTDFTSDRLTGIYQMHFSLRAGEEQGINDPAYLARLDRFTAWLREQPEVDHVSTLSDTMKRLNKNLHDDDASFYRLPEHRDLAGQYLLLYEMSLPYGLDINNQVDVPKSATKVTATIKRVGSRDLRAIEERSETWLRNELPGVMHTEAAGPVLMFSKLSLQNIKSMTGGTLMAFLLIALILILSLRSLRLGLLSLVPNIVPTLIAFGVWAVIVREVGMNVATVVAASLGIIVDATVHFLSKYLRARREQNSTPEDAVRYALSTVGGALWITFMILIVGFSVLALSSFKLNAHFGLLVAITIGAALLADFLLLPVLLMRIDRRSRQPSPTGA